MRVYFLSEKPCALTVNGVHFGMTDLFERSAEINPKDAVCVEFAPFGEFLPVRFLFDEAFLFAPPPQIELYFTEKGVAVYAHGFFRSDQSLRVLWQERFGQSLLTLCLQGKLQLNVENETGFHLLPLPDALEKSTAREWQNGYLLESDSAFALIGRGGTVSVLSEGKILSSEAELEAEVPFHDALGHTAVCRWQADGSLASCKIRTVREVTEATFALALFESALIGADCAPYLAENLQEKAKTIKDFLGNFRSVVLTDQPNKVGLVYERKERVYDVRYFTVTLTEGKISNIVPI